MELQINQKYSSRWASAPWTNWKSRFEANNIDLSALQEGSKGKRPEGSLAMEEYSVSSYGLIMLLLMWQKGLSKASGEKAKVMLQYLIQAFLPDKAYLHYQENSQGMNVSGMNGMKGMMEIEHGFIKGENALAFVDGLRRSSFRWDVVA
eukprot:7626180-Lingulodinium_polyedra.AAC.1